MRRLMFVVTTEENMGDLALCQEWIGDLGRSHHRFAFVIAAICRALSIRQTLSFCSNG
jgi:hypothetical protein